MTGMPPEFVPVPPVPIPESDEELNNEITRLAGHINAAQYRFLKLLAALIEREAWGGNGIKSPAHWLNYYCGISLGPAREKVRVAQCLGSLPLIDAAFSRGELSYSKVRAMTRSATPENEHVLLEVARFGTASHVEKLVRQHRSVQRFEVNEEDKTPELNYYYDDDGMLVFRGRLRPEDGVLLIQAMQKLIDGDQHTKNVSAETSLPEEKKTYPEKRADALIQMAEHVLATDGENLATLNGGDKYQVVVHMQSQADEHRTDSYIEDGPVITPATVERLACDAARVTVTEDKDGNVLNVGRKTRTVPPAIRRALQNRDKGCRFPGCCQTRHVDAHHIHHWCRGGETSLGNLVLLCRTHHRLIHEAGYDILKDENRNMIFVDPNGKPIPPSLYPQFKNKNVSAETFFEIERDNVALGLDITPATAVTAWQGEVMDYDMGVEALLDLTP